MESTLEITLALHLKGTEITYGKFALGTDRKTAIETFNLLKGAKEHTGGCMIQVVLAQTLADLPIPLDTIFCNMDQLKENVGIISREIFRIAQLEEKTIKPLQ